MFDFRGCRGDVPGVLASLISDALGNRKFLMFVNKSVRESILPSVRGLISSTSLQATGKWNNNRIKMYYENKTKTIFKINEKLESGRTAK